MNGYGKRLGSCRDKRHAGIVETAVSHHGVLRDVVAEPVRDIDVVPGRMDYHGVRFAAGCNGSSYVGQGAVHFHFELRYATATVRHVDVLTGGVDGNGDGRYSRQFCGPCASIKAAVGQNGVLRNSAVVEVGCIRKVARWMKRQTFQAVRDLCYLVNHPVAELPLRLTTYA